MRYRQASPRRRPLRPVRLRLEHLESRLAPATLVDPTTVAYRDGDGDAVAVTSSRPVFDAATVDQVLRFNTGSVNGDDSVPQRLQTIDLALLGPAAAGTSLEVKVTAAVRGSKGLVNVGAVDAHGIDLDSVTIHGDLARILAGDADTSTAGLQELTINSMGRFGNATQGPGASLFSVIQGKLGILIVHGDMQASLSVTGGADGRISAAQVDGRLLGGPAAGSGRIASTGDMGYVTISSGIQGGAGVGSGVLAAEGQIVSVYVGSGLTGGAGDLSGQITASSYITSAEFTGPIVGYSGAESGEITSLGGMGWVRVGGDVRGGLGRASGRVRTAGDVYLLLVTGSVLGGEGQGSGVAVADGGMSHVSVWQDVRGGSGRDSGCIQCVGDMADVAVTGSLIGTTSGSGLIQAAGVLGNVVVLGDVQGGSVTGVDDVDRSGYIEGGRITSVFVGGDVFAGSRTGTGLLNRSGSIRSANDIGTVHVEGSLVGSDATPVVISARGQPVPGTRQDLAIRKVEVLQQVNGTEILAGYDVTGHAVNGDAQIGTVYCGGDWTAGTVAAGVGRGADGRFGTADDAPVAGASKQTRSRINLIVVLGTVAGTAASEDPGDQYGFVAELVHGMKVGGTALTLNAGPHNDAVELGSTGDVTLREV